MSSEKSKEDLVAYLDGELPDEQASQVEKSLAENASVRRDVEQLTKTFDLLDLLPEPKASDGFAEKTLTAIRTQSSPRKSETTDEVTSATQASAMSRRVVEWGIRVAAFAGLLVAATIGFNRSFRQDSEPIDELLTELPVIQRLDEYQETGDVEFLKALSESGLFNERDQAPQD
ncbi:MAG: hypothetical protein HQ518_31645 [Rhodopirellula sp.]|nr:hypothetical protein [Rhodopirellula sp.]